MNDAFLVRVLDGAADVDEQLQSFTGAQTGLVTVVGDGKPANQFHDEVRPATGRGAAIEHLGDVRMVHQRQRLPLRLEPRDNLARVHAGLDDLERYLALHRLDLLGHEHRAETTFADLLEQLVAANHHPGSFEDHVRLGQGDGLRGEIDAWLVSGFCLDVALAAPGLLEGKLHQAFGAATAWRVFRQWRSALAAGSFGGHLQIWIYDFGLRTQLVGRSTTQSRSTGYYSKTPRWLQRAVKSVESLNC